MEGLPYTARLPDWRFHMNECRQQAGKGLKLFTCMHGVNLVYREVSL